ncbi:MAG: PEP-CTERM system TPR-repeat protein PrsT [Methylovulum sp.]|nr:PEP-CTERM system TPR-repeat protein PrsT [Methylovulum sp.]
MTKYLNKTTRIGTPSREGSGLQNKRPSLTGCFLATLLFVTVPAHDIFAADNIQASRYYEEAVIQFRSNDTKAAIINLRNALQQNPKYLAAHILLGQAYLREKDLAVAEHELLLAEKLGADKTLLVLSWAQLYLYEIRYSQLLQEINPSQYSSTLQPELYLYRGHAHFQMNHLNEALKEYETAAQLNPQQAGPILGKANVLLRRGDMAGATLAADKATRLEPQNAETWYIQAAIKHAQGDMQQAIKNYDKSIGINPDHLDARLARAGALMDLDKDDQALLDLDYLRKSYPFDPRAAYLRAVVLERSGHKDEAHKELEAAADILLQIKPEFLDQHAQSLMLTGLVNYSLQRFDLATAYLKKYIGQFPQQPGAYKLLGTILLSKGEANKVIELLEPALKYAANDYRFLLLLGTAYAQTGRHDRANTLLEKASAMDTYGDDIHTELGMNRLTMGQDTLAIGQLEKAVKNKPENTKAGIALVVMYIKRHQGAKALPIAKAMYGHAPDNLTLLNLYGTAQVAAGQTKQARLSFEKALSLNADFITAHLNLSKLDVAEKKRDLARQRLTALNKKFPQNIAVLLELAQVDQSTGDYDKASEWLEQAQKTDEKSLPVVLALIDNKLKAGKYPEALNVAVDAQKDFRHNVQLLEALARCYVADGQRGKATAVLHNMVDEVGFDAKQLYQISRQQTALADYAGAIKSLQKAAQGNAAYLPAQIALTELQLSHGERIYALNGAQSLLEQYPDKAIGYRLMGDIDSHDKNFSHAVINYQTALAKEKNADLLMRLYLALKQANDAQKAFNVLEQWVKAHPQDKVPMLALAEEHLQAKQWEKAQKYYEQLLKTNKNQPLLLNNLAYIYFTTGNAKALDYAEQAQKLTPDQPSSNDTLGWILVNKDQPERGLEYLRTAHARSSQDPEIRYHLAVALYRLNRIEEAKLELEQVLQEKQTFNGIEDARALLDKLR